LVKNNIFFFFKKKEKKEKVLHITISFITDTFVIIGKRTEKHLLSNIDINLFLDK